MNKIDFTFLPLVCTEFYNYGDIVELVVHEVPYNSE